MFQQEKFDHPVFLDSENTINALNHFPSQPEYQCFLLDKDNKVLIVGNPVLNPKIWELYKQAITGEKPASKPEELTTAQPDKTAHDYGVIQITKQPQLLLRLFCSENEVEMRFFQQSRCAKF